MANTAANGGASPTTWWTWLFGQPAHTVLLVIMAAWVANYLLIPMRDDQKRFMDTVILTNQEHAKAAVANAAANQSNATTNATIAEHMRDTKQILQQIRDDQRRFPAIARESP